MILDKIVLNNFGLYAGSQTITLTPPSPKRPIILIGGLNGGGKTTFLDALQLCLFGPHARISNRGTLAYQEYLSRSIHRGASDPEAGIEIYFRHTVGGREEKYRLNRSWHRSGKGCSERVAVWKNGEPEYILADHWASQVEEFFPSNIAHLFLFDGEQAEAYAAGQEDSSALIGAAIQNLLGLDMVDRLQKDLVIYERKKRVQDKADPHNEEIVETQNTVRKLHAQIESLNQERAALRTHRIDRCQRALKEIDDIYRKSGGELYDRRVEIEKNHHDAKQAVRETETALRQLAAGILPLVLSRTLLESAEFRDQHEEECRRARDLYETLKSRDRAILRNLRKSEADPITIEKLKKLMTVDRAKRHALSKKQTVLDIHADVRSDIHILLRGDLETVTKDSKMLLGRINKLRKKADQTQTEQKNVPDDSVIAQISADREALRKELSELESVHMAMGHDIERQKRELERNSNRLARLVDEEMKARGVREDRTRILQYSGKVRTTIDMFREAVIERHVRRIEHLVLESYLQLLRKSALVTRLSIDPKTLGLTLFGRDGKVLSVERLSAGERQLLAIALLWGLAKASGRPLPTVIDTPLGRLDSDHRMNFVERYLPFASHQVILLSTDEEIIGDYFDKLSPWVGRTYQLSYNNKSGESQIRSGYFKGKTAA